jgi:hyperosmotically inducible protein
MDTGDAAAQAVSDTWITTKVKSVLLADSEAKGLEVNVDTKDGVVSLEGELPTQAAIDHVEALARDVEGVKRVNSTALNVARN